MWFRKFHVFTCSMVSDTIEMRARQGPKTGLLEGVHDAALLGPERVGYTIAVGPEVLR